MTWPRNWICLFLAIALSGFSSAAHAQTASQETDLILTAGEDLPTSGPEFNELIERAIRVTSQRKLTAGVHTPWQVVHGVLAQRWDLKMIKKDNPKEEVSGIEWIMGGAYFDGMPLWEATPYGGRGHPFTRPYAFEGHPTQFLGYMCMADIPLDYEVQTPTKIITVRDIVNDAKMQVHTGVEITWTLWALAHYLDSDEKWFNAAGEPWSIERLVKMQTDEQVTSGACGGCHGLFALCYARNLSMQPNKPLRGVWFEADQKIKQHIALAKALQNSDGSFSSEHFKGPGYSSDFLTRITTSGHQLEWLMIAVPNSKLKEEWLRRGIANVARDLINNAHVASDCGPLFHGMHALVLYRQRTDRKYLVPQFNSHIKLAERGRPKGFPVEEAAKSAAPAASPVKIAQPIDKNSKGAEVEKFSKPIVDKPASVNEDVPANKTPESAANPTADQATPTPSPEGSASTGSIGNTESSIPELPE